MPKSLKDLPPAVVSLIFAVLGLAVAGIAAYFWVWPLGQARDDRRYAGWERSAAAERAGVQRGSRAVDIDLRAGRAGVCSADGNRRRGKPALRTAEAAARTAHQHDSSA